MPVPHGSSSERTKTRLRGVAPLAPQGASTTPATIGRYEVLEVIGKGAMGVVYKGRDPLLDRIVAIKTIYAPAQLGERVRKAFLERFEREAKAAARIAHPAIVTIFDVGLSQDNPYLVMEYLPGETLADKLDRERMPLAAAVECARELASALGCAHKERIVHRDVKPANVLHAGETRWKLADFGIARLPDSDLTQIGTFMGTPGYAPPEAIREGRYTVQADVFAWGAVFYELLTGRVPYEGPDTETTNKFVIRAEPPSPRSIEPSVPEPLSEVAMRALAHDPSRRYANGTEAAEALRAAWERSLASGAIGVAAFTGSSPRVAVPAAPPLPAARPAAPLPRPAPAQALATQVDPRVDTAAPTEENQLPPELMGARVESSREREDAPQVIRTGPLDRSRIAEVAPPPRPASRPSESNAWLYFVVLAFLAAGALAAYWFLRT